MTWSVLLIVLIIVAGFAIITLLTDSSGEHESKQHFILEVKATFNDSICNYASISDLNDSRCWNLVQERDIDSRTVDLVIVAEIIFCLGILISIYYYCFGFENGNKRGTVISAPNSPLETIGDHEFWKSSDDNLTMQTNVLAALAFDRDHKNIPPLNHHRSNNFPAYTLVNTFED